MSRICKCCGNPVKKRKSVCEECKKIQQLECENRQNIKTRNKNRKFRICELCGKRFERTGISGVVKYCLTCSAIVEGVRSSYGNKRKEFWIEKARSIAMAEIEEEKGVITLGNIINKNFVDKMVMDL